MDNSLKLTYSVREASRLFGLSRNALYAACAQGQIPVLRIGKRILIPKARLLALLGGPGENDEDNGSAAK
jgi:excisionase family DNA binding protein